MMKLGEAIKKHVNLKPKLFNIDNIVFKMHYRVTCWLLLAFTGILCVEEYNKNKIRCTHSDPTDSKKQLEHVIDTFCFFMSTFTVTKHHNNSNEDVAYPGVGPADEGEEIIRHWYYQWVPYVLFLQAIAFYVPHYIWRNKEGGRLAALVEGFHFIKMLNKETSDSVHESVKNSFNDRIQVYRSWLLWLFGCEVLNLVNLILQVYLTNLFLGGRFWDLGNLVYQHYGSDQFNPLDMAFPKMAKCTFQKYGSSGSQQVHDVVCVLSLNIINEKIFLTLWYWYIILAVASVVMLVHRILSYALYSTGIKYNASVFVSELTMKPSSRDLLVLMKHLNYSEWFFLQCLATNLDGKLSVDLLRVMADNYQPVGHIDDSTPLKQGENFTYEKVPTLALKK